MRLDGLSSMIIQRAKSILYICTEERKEKWGSTGGLDWFIAIFETILDDLSVSALVLYLYFLFVIFVFLCICNGLYFRKRRETCLIAYFIVFM